MIHDLDADDLAFINQTLAEDDRLRAEREWEASRRAAEAPPVRKTGPDGLVFKDYDNNAPPRALTHDAPAGDESAPDQGFSLFATPDVDRAFFDVIGESFADERLKVEQASAPLQRQIAGMQQELAELRGFRDGLVGRDVPTAWFKLRGEYQEGHVYSRLDIVSRNGAWWIARCDDPGPIGSDGWKEGPHARDGEKGERGERGLRGVPGRAAPKFVSWDVDHTNYRAIAKMSDGSTMTLELRPLFAQFLDEIERRNS